MKKPRIMVVGSMNMDLFVRDCNALPTYGQSIISGDYGYATGGKGSNQAFAAAKLGGDVTMVGRVGRDSNGDQLLASLKSAGVNVDYVVRDEAAQTGLALMLVNSDGRYVAYVSIGANYRLVVDDVRRALEAKQADDATPASVPERYWEVFTGCFEGVDFNPVTFKYHDAGWDSVAHLRLISRLEEAFQVKFNGREAMRLKSYNAGLTLIQKKLEPADGGR